LLHDFSSGFVHTYFFAYSTSCRQLGTLQLKSPPPTGKMLLMHRWPTTGDEGPTDTDNATLAMTVRKRTCDRKQSTKDDHGNNSNDGGRSRGYYGMVW
jgi:hypothetical protein